MNCDITRSLIVALATTAAIAIPGLTTAEESDSASGKEGASTAAGFEEIVVTARRREESLQEVPLAITALSGDELQKLNATKVENLGAIVPSLVITPSNSRRSSPSFALRGQRQDAQFTANDQSVGIYVAEAVQARVFGLSKSLFDLESVQVLKGPQGTLFGRNTTGGAILFQPRRPDFDGVGGYASVRLGNFGQRDFEGALNVPLSDTLALRVGVNWTQQDGYVRDVNLARGVNQDNSIASRAVLLFEPGTGWNNTLYLDYFTADEPGSTASRLTSARPGSTPDIRYGLADVLESQRQNLDFWQTEQDWAQAVSKGRNLGATNVTTFELSESMRLKNILNYREVDARERQDLDGTAFPVLHLEQLQTAEQVSEELQLQGEAIDSRLNWIVGAYYFREEGTADTFTSVNGTVANPRYTKLVNKSYSVFAQGDYRLTDTLSTTLGGRFTWDERSIDQRLLNATTLACIFCAKDSDKFESPTYTASLNWQFAPSKLVYLATRTGYRSGGFNSSANTAAAMQGFDPEDVTDYELGLKADWKIGKASLRSNLAVFHTDYEDIQRAVIKVVDGVPVTTIFNAAEATIDGGEIELTLEVSDVSITASAAFVEPDYKVFVEETPAGVIDRSGNDFAYIPHETYRLGASWLLPLKPASGGDFTLSADYYWQSEVYFSEFNDPTNFQDSYGLLNARLAWSKPFGVNMEVALWGRNLTAEEYFVSAGGNYASSGYTYSGIGNPRTYGLELRFEL